MGEGTTIAFLAIAAFEKPAELGFVAAIAALALGLAFGLACALALARLATLPAFPSRIPLALPLRELRHGALQETKVHLHDSVGRRPLPLFDDMHGEAVLVATAQHIAGVLDRRLLVLQPQPQGSPGCILPAEARQLVGRLVARVALTTMSSLDEHTGAERREGVAAEVQLHQWAPLLGSLLKVLGEHRARRVDEAVVVEAECGNVDRGFP
mmetsp:Transcript_63318/g.182128  ORF Transcript_63318/g.182128 Transcript_63318/m.182128 type:complete len:211 (-) Transcript_63318:282-914(-)